MLVLISKHFPYPAALKFQSGSLFDHPKVGKPHALQWRFFQGLQYSPQSFAQARMPLDDIIVGTEDGSFGHNLHRQPGKQSR